MVSTRLIISIPAFSVFLPLTFIFPLETIVPFVAIFPFTQKLPALIVIAPSSSEAANIVYGYLSSASFANTGIFGNIDTAITAARQTDNTVLNL